MVSEETTVHVACVVAGFVALGALTAAGVTDAILGQVLALGLFYGLALGGAHLYFALRDEDGMVPVRGRWRFLVLVGCAVALIAVVTVAGDADVGGLSLYSLAGLAFVAVLVAYFLLEGLAGYRQSVQRP